VAGATALAGRVGSLLARLSVFAGGWDLEAAEAVGVGPEVPPVRSTTCGWWTTAAGAPGERGVQR
jgi:hypothetical protein